MPAGTRTMVMEARDIHWIRCPKCGKRLNHYSRWLKLDKPVVFGRLTDNPETMTHVGTLRCARGCTAVLIHGREEEVTGFFCGDDDIKEVPDG